MCDCNKAYLNTNCNCKPDCSEGPCGCKTSSDDVVYQGAPLECIGVENCDTLTEVITKIDEYACGPDIIQNFLNTIINNPTVNEEFITLVQSIITCEVIWACGVGPISTTTSTTTVLACTSYTLSSTLDEQFWTGMVCGLNVVVGGVINTGESVDTGCILEGTLVMDAGIDVDEQSVCSGPTCGNFNLEGMVDPTGSWEAIECLGFKISGTIDEGANADTGCIIPQTLQMNGVVIKEELGPCTVITTTTICPTCDEWEWSAIGKNDSNLVYIDCENGPTLIDKADITDTTGSICVAKDTIPFWVPTPFGDGIHALQKMTCCAP